ncbi:carbohydrate kinase family protein, partial [Patescibacteria group bacterium]|nr:carbohydrate kinase family protein [Patescibacteria group bacterium]
VVLVSPTNKEDMLLFVEKAHGVGVTCFFDPGQQIPALSKEELQRAISFSTALFVNDYELALVLEKTGLTEQDILDQVDFLIVTLGSEGVRIATKENDTRIPAVSAVAVDPTGAGDAFRAGFVVGHVSGLSLELSSKVGATVAAYAVEAHGGQNHLPSTEDLSGRFTASYGEAWPL